MRLFRTLAAVRRAPADRGRSIWPLRATARGSALLATLAILAAAVAPAQTAIPAYSADAVYRAPDGQESTGRVVKSGPDMRLEFTENGRSVVQIIRRAEGTMYVLDPATQSYFKVQGLPDPNAGEAVYVPPCDLEDPSITCRFLGNEVTSGITAEAWEIGQPGQPGQAGQSSRILWDGARQRALRQEFSDGTVMALTFKAMEQINGRSVENWAITVTSPNQQPKSGSWYYDPEIRVEIRESLPSGEMRSLENIFVGTVDPGAFTVPAGWAEVAPPQAPAPGGSGVPTPPSAN